MPRVLLATCAAFPAGDEDAGLLAAALREIGIDVAWADWSDPTVDWDSALVVLRSTWDYTTRRAQFLQWVERLRLVANPAEVVRWNSDKVYLRDLEKHGVPVVESYFVAPGETLDITHAFGSDGEIVVKPSVGAGSRGAQRFGGGRYDDASSHARTLHAQGVTALVQPYLSQVDDLGETALVYIDGTFSHAATKGAMLTGDGASTFVDRDLFFEEHISPRTATSAELAVGDLALAAVRERFGTDLLYTRVDLLPSADGPVVIELELVEPSLFLSEAAGAPQRFAAAIAARS